MEALELLFDNKENTERTAQHWGRNIITDRRTNATDQIQMLQQYYYDIFLHAQNTKREPDCCESNHVRSQGVNSGAGEQSLGKQPAIFSSPFAPVQKRTAEEQS